MVCLIPRPVRKAENSLPLLLMISSGALLLQTSAVEGPSVKAGGFSLKHKEKFTEIITEPIHRTYHSHRSDPLLCCGTSWASSNSLGGCAFWTHS